MEPEKATSMMKYMSGFSMVGFLMMIVLGSIAERATLSIISFGIVTISLLVSVFIPISSSKEFRSFKLLVLNNIPVFFTILLSIWSIIIYGTYFENINEGKVANEFYDFSNMSKFVLAVQIIVSFFSLNAFLNNLFDKDKEINDVQKGKMNAVLYLITPLNVMLLIVVNVILKFFSTDG